MMQSATNADVEYPLGRELIDWINNSDDFPLDKAHRINDRRWSYEHGGKFRKFSESALRSIEFFYENPSQRPVGPLLDLGCAGGHHLEYCAEKGIQPLYGIDIGEPYVRKARERAPHALLQQGDFLNLPYASNSFNSIVARGVFHLTTTKGLLLALREAYRVLKNGGLIYIHRRYKPALLEEGRARRLTLFTYAIYRRSLDTRPSQKIWMIRNFVPEPQLTSIIKSVGFLPLGDPPATIFTTVDERGDIRHSLAYVCVKK